MEAALFVQFINKILLLLTHIGEVTKTSTTTTIGCEFASNQLDMWMADFGVNDNHLLQRANKCWIIDFAKS